MFSSYFNVAVSSKESNFFVHQANAGFAPLRYLFRGRTVEVIDEKIIKEYQSFSENKNERYSSIVWSRHNLNDWMLTAKKVLPVALALILLIPGLIWGVGNKLIAYCFESTRRDLAIANKLLSQPFVPPAIDLNIAPGLDVADGQAWMKFALMTRKLTSKEIWKDPAFIQEVSEFMEEAYNVMVIYFNQLETRHNGNRDEMAQVMVRQPQSYLGVSGDKLPECIKRDTTDYCHRYFQGSLTDIYHLARGCQYLVDNPCVEGEMMMRCWSLDTEDQTPYFTTGTPQYRWRMLYNDFCQMLDRYGLREKLNGSDNTRGLDQRFGNWAKPDTHFVESYGAPDMRPT